MEKIPRCSVNRRKKESFHKLFGYFQKVLILLSLTQGAICLHHANNRNSNLKTIKDVPKSKNYPESLNEQLLQNGFIKYKILISLILS